MAYACPVCATPQADGRHLANHLAFTAMIHGDDHEAWLDEHAPAWEQEGEKALAERVVGEAVETELSEAIADPTEREGGSEGSPEAESESRDQHRERHSEDERAERAGKRGDRPPTSGEEPHGEGSRVPIGIGAEIGDTEESGGDGNGEIAAVLAEARELTERMREGSDPDGKPEENDRNDRNDDPTT